MKNIFSILTAVIFLSGFSSCQKDGPEKVNFDVIPDKTTLSTSDSVTFNFTGDADVISFYSGEKGKQYKYKNRIKEEGSRLELTVSSKVLNGSQENNLKLLYSTSFSGIYTKENINEAEDWKDITNKFVWSTAPGNNQSAANYTVSGPIDITDIIEPNKPIFFAFKYESQAAANNALGGKTYRIPVFDLVNVASDGTRSSLANFRNIVNKSIPIINTSDDITNKWVIASNSATDVFLQFVPNIRSQAHLHWAISSPFTPGSVNPDKPGTLKAYLDKMPTSYNYRFKTPGTYIVSFVAKNVNSNGEKALVKEIEITVN